MIRIQNIYHMLAYAFQVLREQGYRDVATEEFANTAELCAAILERGVSSQLKRGLGREYIDRTDALSTLHGKIEVSESVKTRSVLRRQMVCSYDEFSVDTRMNRILKATMVLLVRSDIDKARKKELKKLLVYFSDVGGIDLATVDWHMRFDRNNQTYRMLMNVCWLVAKGLLQTQADGTSRLMDFLDEQRMSRLYEKFILEYYRREHHELDAGAPYIGWVLDDDFDDMLPAMHTDISLTRGGTVLIIDAKYYSRTTQQQFDKRSVHSGNLYQIFTYVKNKEAELVRAGIPHEVSGMLLYARTDEEIQPDATYQMSGNRIDVRTLDLDQPFYMIQDQLDSIARTYFPACRKKGAPMENGLEGGVHYCPNCNSTLETQVGFDPEKNWWKCQCCGEMLFGEDVYEGERFPSVMWFCDECNDFLNAQAGFNDLTDTWVCSRCGHSSEISEAALG